MDYHTMESIKRIIPWHGLLITVPVLILFLEMAAEALARDVQPSEERTVLDETN